VLGATGFYRRVGAPFATGLWPFALPHPKHLRTAQFHPLFWRINTLRMSIFRLEYLALPWWGKAFKIGHLADVSTFLIPYSSARDLGRIRSFLV